MRLLVINPNTNQTTTARIAAVARATASPGTEIHALSARSDVVAIETLEQSELAGKAVTKLVKQAGADFDAVIVAAFSDPGLRTARAVYARPVVGIAEAAMFQAASLGQRFAVITVGACLVNRIWQLAEEYGARDRLVSIRLLPWSVSEATMSYDRNLDAIRSECQRSVMEDEVVALILGGGPLSGLAGKLECAVGVPILDGVACAVRRAEMLVMAGPK